MNEPNYTSRDDLDPSQTWLTTAQVARAVGLTVSALKERRRRGKGPDGHRVGHRTYLYALEQVEAWAKERGLEVRR